MHSRHFGGAGWARIAAILAALAVLAVGAASAATQTTTCMSASLSGPPGSGFSQRPDITADGRFVVFDSNAPNLVSGDTNGAYDVFIRNHALGVTARLSVSSSGTQALGASLRPSISADAHYVAFDSLATNLVAGDGGANFDIFVRDLYGGSTLKVSTALAGLANGDSRSPSISGNGRFIAFQSEATNLVAGDTNGEQDVFVWDVVTSTMHRVSVSSMGAQANDESRDPTVAAYAGVVAFSSDATNLIPDDDNGVEDVFVHDLDTGQTTRVSVASDGTDGNDPSEQPSISADGRYVAFRSEAEDLVPDDTNFHEDIFVHDRQTGQTTRVSVASDGTQANWHSDAPSISADGRYVAFRSAATNLVPDDDNGRADIFVHDRQTGQTHLVSVSTGGAQGNLASADPAINGDGRYVAFESEASNLTPGDGNFAPDVFLRDRLGGRPDLYVHNIAVVPRPATAGSDVTIGVAIGNLGTLASPEHTVAIWRHRNTVPGPGAAGDYTHRTGGLSPGDYSIHEETFVPTFPGDRTAHVYVDVNWEVDEVLETNNTASREYSINPTNADLAFSTFTVTPNPVSLGEEARILSTVRNYGTDPSRECLLQLWRHRPGQPVLGTTGDFTRTVGALGPSGAQAFTTDFYPHYQGPRTAWGLVDSQNVVAENNEGNNKASAAYSIEPGITPDLTCGVTITPNPVALGESVEMLLETHNSGPVAAGPFTLAGWRHRTDPPIVGSPLDVTCSISGLAPDATEVRTATFTPNYTGSRTAWGFADSANDVIENNEVNNIASRRYEIVPADAPDLVASISVTPDPIALGTEATAVARIDNAGRSDAGESAAGVWFHRSDPPVVGTPPDREGLVPALEAGRAFSTPPLRFTPGFAGDRTAWVFADIQQDILETNESNNVASDDYTIAEVVATGALAVTAAGAEATRGGQVAVGYSLSAPASVEVRLRNVAGRLVARVRAGERDAGTHTETWNGLGTGGARVPAGLYLCEIVARNEDGQSARAVASVRLGR